MVKQSNDNGNNIQMYIWTNNILLGLLGSIIFILYQLHAKQIEQNSRDITQLQIRQAHFEERIQK